MSHLDTRPAQQDSVATRASLLGRLRDWDDSKSWEEFTEIYWRLIYSVARRSGLSESDARDVVQDTLLGVAKKIHQFESDPQRGTFRGWLLNQTRWRIADHFRARPPTPAHGPNMDSATGDGTATIHRIPDPSQIDESWESEWKKNLVDTAFARITRKVNPKHAQIFDLYALRGWRAAKVAQELGVSVVQVYLVNHRLTKLLKEEVAFLQNKLD
jgi:RNA polymerase sigma factor (sigma-70 family)